MSISKILFRRGTDAQRRNAPGVLLAAGEPAFCTDTRRLFVGDGTTVGGVPAGITNLGTVSALFGNYSNGYDITGYTALSLSGVMPGDIIYDRSTSILYSLTSVSTIPPLSTELVPYSTAIQINQSQLSFIGTQLNIANDAIGPFQINSSAVDGVTLSKLSNSSPIQIANNGVKNVNLAQAPANSVKANPTNSTATPTDLTVNTNQIVTNIGTGLTALPINSNQILLNPGTGLTRLTVANANQFIGSTAATGLTSVSMDAVSGVNITATGNKITFDGSYLLSLINNLSANMNKIGNYPYLEYGWVTAPNVAGQSIAANTITTLTINTEVADTGSYGSISSNQITLAAGTYYFEAFSGIDVASNSTCPFGLYNITDSKYETRQSIGQSSTTNGSLYLNGQIVLASQKTFDLRITSSIAGTIGAPVGTNTTANADQRTTLKLWKVG